MPSFSRTPARITEPPVGASVWASGSHVCTGKMGHLMAKEAAKARNSQRAVLSATDWPSARLTRSKVRPPGGLLAEEHQGQDADQHQGRAEHRVDEELEGGVDPPLVAPPADEEVHRDEHDLPEQEEHEQVERQEHPDAARLQQEHPRHVALAVVVDVGPAMASGKRMPLRTTRNREIPSTPSFHEIPNDSIHGWADTNWKPPSPRVEVEEQDQAEQADQQGDAEADPGHHVVAVLGQEGHQARAEGGDQDQQGEDGDVVSHQLRGHQSDRTRAKARMPTAPRATARA